MVLAAPVLALCLLLIVQFGVWSHALHVASAAAQEGARAARVENGSEQAGEQRARDLLNQVGKQVLVSPTVTACRNDQVAKVEVRGKAVSIVPGLPLPVHAVSTGPVERFRSVKESPSDRAATC
jgi:Flp pilus assembly protein TadG